MCAVYLAAPRVATATGDTCPAVTSPQNLGQLFVYQGTTRLGDNKKRIVAACRELGCSEDQINLFVGMAMQESENCCASERDMSKDNTLSANHSCFNMNEDYLMLLGWHHGGTDLNNNDNVLHAIAYLIAGSHEWGVDGMLAFHRGGRTALNDRVSYGAQEYISKMMAVAAYLKAHPEHLTDDWRVGYHTPHV